QSSVRSRRSDQLQADETIQEEHNRCRQAYSRKCRSGAATRQGRRKPATPESHMPRAIAPQSHHDVNSMADIRRASSKEGKPEPNLFAESNVVSFTLLTRPYRAAKQHQQQRHHGQTEGEARRPKRTVSRSPGVHCA